MGLWVRKVPPNNFLNIERDPANGPEGGGGALYLEVPSSHVSDLLGMLGGDVDEEGNLILDVGVIGRPKLVKPLTFSQKTGDRLRLFQNRQTTPSRRHPAWSPAMGFPKAPDDVRDRHQVTRYIAGGLRVFLARTKNGKLFAGFLIGDYPANWPDHPRLKQLFSGDGGVERFHGGLWLAPESQSQPFREADEDDSEGKEAEPSVPEAISALPPPAATPGTPGYASPQVSIEVDRVAMKLAMKYARERFPDASIMQQTHNNPGFDILVTNAGAPHWYIEVKGTTQASPTFFMTETERRFSQAKRERYTLVVFYELDVKNERAKHTALDGEVGSETSDLFEVAQWRCRLRAR